MRFQIQQCLNPNAPFQLHLGDTIVSVRRPVLERELQWTWRDGTEYRLIYPDPTEHKEMEWHIISEERTICSAHLVFPPLRSVPRLKSLPRVEWSLCGAVVVYQKRGCLGCHLGPKDGKTLAYWRHRGWFMPPWKLWFDGVWRNGLPEGVAAIVFGMILARIHNDDSRGGDD